MRKVERLRSLKKIKLMATANCTTKEEGVIIRGEFVTVYLKGLDLYCNLRNFLAYSKTEKKM